LIDGRRSDKFATFHGAVSTFFLTTSDASSTHDGRRNRLSPASAAAADNGRPRSTKVGTKSTVAWSSGIRLASPQTNLVKENKQQQGYRPNMADVIDNMYAVERIRVKIMQALY